MNTIRQILTDADNTTHNIIRHGIFWGFLALVALQVLAVFRGQAFDPQAFGLAICGLLGGGGLGIGLSVKAEPSTPAVAAGKGGEA